MIASAAPSTPILVLTVLAGLLTIGSLIYRLRRSSRTGAQSEKIRAN